MRIALVCSGLGRVHRGFETATSGLFMAIRRDVNVTLYKGGGTRAAGEVRVLNLPRKTSGRWLNDLQAYQLEQTTFAVALCPLLLAHRPDIIHYSDGRLGNLIRRFRNLCSLNFKTILWNGAPFSPGHSAAADFIQQVTQTEYEKALDHGITSSKMKVLPYGLDCGRFSDLPNRTESSKQFGIPAGRHVVVSVAAISGSQKRIDHLIREVATLPRHKYFLLVAGQRTDETSGLERMAREMLGDSFRFITVPNRDIPAVYSVADTFVHCSLSEGLGIVILEAMAAGRPILAHDGEPFRWIIGNKDSLIDMQMEGRLASSIEAQADNPESARSGAARNLARVRHMFDWSALAPGYLDMYTRLIETNPVRHWP